MLNLIPRTLKLLPSVYEGRAGGMSRFAETKLLGYRQNLCSCAKL